MDIQNIKISGYKNIDSISIDIKDNISLVSINNFGKSNFLNGIIFGLNIINEKNKDTFLDFVPDMPINKKIYKKNYSFEISFNYKEKLVCYGYEFSWKDKKFTKEYLNIKEDDSQKFKAFIKRNGEAYYKQSETGSCNKTIIIANNELIINKLQAFDNLYYIDIINELNSISMYIDRHFDVNNSYYLQPIKRNVNFNLKYNLANDNNIPMILNEIKKMYPDKYELIVNTFKDLFPNIKEMEALETRAKMNESNDFLELYTIAIHDKNLKHIIDFNLMSDGARKILLILTNLVLAEINNYSLVAIEEPENSLNPRILQQYLIILHSFTKVKIIITSHSPYLINYLSPENIYVGIPNNDGLANFSKIKKTAVSKLCSDAKELNMYTGDYLFDLMSGSADDVKQILKYTE